MVNDNNCQKKIPDCFHLNGLKQIGVNPYTQPPTESELAFENRYTKIGGKKKRLLKGGRGCVNAISPASYTFDLTKECQFAEVSALSQECGSKAIKMEGGKRKKLLRGGRGSVNATSPASYTFDLSKECQFAEVSPVSQECGSKAIKMEGGKKNRKTLKKKLRQKNKTRNNKGRRNKSRVNK